MLYRFQEAASATVTGEKAEYKASLQDLDAKSLGTKFETKDKDLSHQSPQKVVRFADVNEPEEEPELDTEEHELTELCREKDSFTLKDSLELIKSQKEDLESWKKRIIWVDQYHSDDEEPVDSATAKKEGAFPDDSSSPDIVNEIVPDADIREESADEQVTSENESEIDQGANSYSVSESSDSRSESESEYDSDSDNYDFLGYDSDILQESDDESLSSFESSSSSDSSVSSSYSLSEIELLERRQQDNPQSDGFDPEFMSAPYSNLDLTDSLYEEESLENHENSNGEELETVATAPQIPPRTYVIERPNYVFG